MKTTTDSYIYNYANYANMKRINAVLEALTA